MLQYLQLSIVRNISQSSTYPTLQWRHNGYSGVANHRPHGCLLDRLSRRRSKKTSKLRVTGILKRLAPSAVLKLVCSSLIQPHKWKCPILSQFYGGYVIHVWHFRYGQERRQWELWTRTVPPGKGVIFQRPIVEFSKVKPLKMCVPLLFSIFSTIVSIQQCIHLLINAQKIQIALNSILLIAVLWRYMYCLGENRRVICHHVPVIVAIVLVIFVKNVA